MAARLATEDLLYEAETVALKNSFDAHRLHHFAADHDKQAETLQRLFLGYFSEDKNIADNETLAVIAAEAGLDKAEAREMLAGDTYSNDVKNDINKAAALGIKGVPYFAIDDTYTISGAQGTEIFSRVLQQAWHEKYLLKTMGGTSSANACTDGTCT